MRTRVLLCSKDTIDTVGFRNIRSSRKYDVLKVIGTDKFVGVSQYSEIVLLYQYPLNETDKEFLDFVKNNQNELKNAVLLFDVPMEVIDEAGIERSVEQMKRISSEVFGENIPFIIHTNPNAPALIEKLSEQLGTEIDDNSNWVKESGHVSVLTTYYLKEASSIPRGSYPTYMATGVCLIIASIILLILRLRNVIPIETTILSTVLLLFGIIAYSKGYVMKTKGHWKKE